MSAEYIRLAVDFGTISSIVAEVVPGEKPRFFRLSSSGACASSSVYLMKNGRLCFGDEAEKMGLSEPAGYCRAYKMKLGSPVFLLGEYTAADLVREHLAWILRKVNGSSLAEGRQVSGVMLTYPDAFSATQRQLLKEAALAAGFPAVELISQTEALVSVCMYGGRKVFAAQDVMMLFWGDGSLEGVQVTVASDFASCKSGRRFNVASVGCEELDDALALQLLAKMTAQAKVSGLSWPRFMNLVREFRKQLLTEGKAEIRLSLRGKKLTVPGTAEEYEELLSAYMKQAGAALRRFVRTNFPSSPPGQVLLSGPGADIPATGRMIASELPKSKVHLYRSVGAAVKGACIQILQQELFTALPEPDVEVLGVPDEPVPQETIFSSVLPGTVLPPVPQVPVLPPVPQEPVTPPPPPPPPPVKKLSATPEDVVFAAAEGDVQQLRKLIADGGDVNAADAVGWTPLWAATYADKQESVRALLSAGNVEVNQPNARGELPLCRAAACGQEAIVGLLLLSPGIDPGKAGYGGNTPMHEAAYAGHAKVLRKLLYFGANLDEANELNWTPLWSAAFAEKLDCLSLLLNGGADVNRVDEHGWALLHHVASTGSLSVLRRLLAFGGLDVQKQTPEGDTALSLAGRYGHAECEALLKSATAASSY